MYCWPDLTRCCTLQQEECDGLRGDGNNLWTDQNRINMRVKAPVWTRNGMNDECSIIGYSRSLRNSVPPVEGMSITGTRVLTALWSALAVVGGGHVTAQRKTLGPMEFFIHRFRRYLPLSISYKFAARLRGRSSIGRPKFYWAAGYTSVYSRYLPARQTSSFPSEWYNYQTPP